MADATKYETKIRITADTSDVDRKIKDLGNVKAPEIQTPKAPKVTVPVETEPTPPVESPAVPKVTIPVDTAPTPEVAAPAVPKVTIPVATAKPPPVESPAVPKVTIPVATAPTPEVAAPAVPKVTIPVTTAKPAPVESPAVPKVTIPVATAKPAPVEAPRVQPVTVPVTTEKAPPVVPPNEPVVTVRVATGKAPPVVPPKAPTVTVKVATAKAPPVDPPKQPPDMWIRTFFDATGVGRAIKGLNAVREAFGKVLAVAGMFGFAVTGVLAIVDSVRRLKTWLDSAAAEAKKLREEMDAKRYAAGVERAADAYERLAKKIALAADAEQRRQKIENERKSTARGIEDAKTDQREQRELAKLDPNANDYAEQAAAIRAKFKVERADQNVARTREDSKTEARDLYKQAAAKDAEARSWRAQMQGQAGQNSDQARIRWTDADKEVTRLTNAHAGADEIDAAKTKRDRLEKEFEAAAAAYVKIRENAEKAERDAQNLRNEAAEKTGGGAEAQIRAQTARDEAQAEQRAAQAAADKKREETERDDADFRARLSKADKDAEWQSAFDRMDDVGKVAALERREDDAATRRDAAQKTYDEESAKTGNDRDEKKIAKAREELAAAQQEQIAARKQREAIQNAARKTNAANDGRDAEAKLDKFAAAFGEGPQNRLTAMGLGAGVRNSGAKTEGHLQNIERLLAAGNDATRRIANDESRFEA